MAKSDIPSRDPSDSSVNRRAFFRRIFTKGVEQFEQAGRAFAEKIQDAMPPEARSTNHKTRISLPIRYLRPPGAMEEPLMTQMCSRCGDCVNACPANCIELDPTGKIALGLPYIVARKSPCVVCTDLSCMKVCPTGALNLVDNLEQINMGTAVLNDASCLRGVYGEEEDCRLCADHCPLGEKAIGIDPDHNIIQVRQGCIGCGVCEQVCPTEPPSIWVDPRRC